MARVYGNIEDICLTDSLEDERMKTSVIVRVFEVRQGLAENLPANLDYKAFLHYSITPAHSFHQAKEIS